jgi:hypothetical protein
VHANVLLVVYAIPITFLIQGVLQASTGLTVTLILGTLTIFSTNVRFVTLWVGTGQPNLVCKYSRDEGSVITSIAEIHGRRSS